MPDLNAELVVVALGGVALEAVKLLGLKGYGRCGINGAIDDERANLGGGGSGRRRK